MSWIAGVDGCSAGWVVVLRNTNTDRCIARVVTSFHDVLTLPEAPSVIAVDVPIGLLDTARVGGRACDQEARRLLRRRASSVFSAPTRPALEAFRAGGDYVRVSSANRGGTPTAPGLSKQTYAIMRKIDEVDAALSAVVQERVREVHPELCFAKANGGAPMEHTKKRTAGRNERIALLERIGFRSPLALFEPRRDVGAKVDDLLDACIACWSAQRIADGTSDVVPPTPISDARGLRMEVWR